MPLVLPDSGFMPPGHKAAQLFAARRLKPTQSVGIAFETDAKTSVVPANAAQELEKLQSCWLKTRAVLDAWL